MAVKTVEVSEPEFTFPPEEGELVAREYARASSILEYGSGGSTVLAARSTDADVLSIESDKTWMENLKAFLDASGISRSGVEVHWANVGATGKWGYPTDQSMWRSYPSYALCPWENFDISPDVILIDGRFRLACLAAAILNVKKPTTILFDDYAARKVYWVAEKLVVPTEMVGRMAKFTVTPEDVSKSMISEIVRWFFIPK